MAAVYQTFPKFTNQKRNKKKLTQHWVLAEQVHMLPSKQPLWPRHLPFPSLPWQSSLELDPSCPQQWPRRHWGGCSFQTWWGRWNTKSRSDLFLIPLVIRYPCTWPRSNPLQWESIRSMWFFFFQKRIDF